MQIDWITVSAQIVNFLVLVYLLQYFLYRPVIQAMDKREQRITDQLAEADRREEEARSQIDTYLHETERLQNERRALIEEYRQEAQGEKQRLLNEAREAVAETRRHWQIQAEREKSRFLEDLERRTEHAVIGIARKALADLADTRLEDRIIEVFTKRLSETDSEAVRVFGGAGGSLRVTTAFELDSGQRARVAGALGAALGRDADIEYRVDPDLVCGIRLGDDGHAVDWNLDDYMSQLAECMERAIESTLKRT